MVELISSPESNSFISHSFAEFVELSLSPDLCRFDSWVDEWFVLSRLFFFDGSKFFSTERQVDRSVFVSSRLLSVARRIRPFDRISSSLELARWNSNRPLAWLTNATTLRIDDHSQSR